MATQPSVLRPAMPFSDVKRCWPLVRLYSWQMLDPRKLACAIFPQNVTAGRVTMPFVVHTIDQTRAHSSPARQHQSHIIPFSLFDGSFELS